MTQPAGKRNCLCRLMEDGGGERDSRGNPTKSPREVAKFWCSMEQLSAAKLQSYQQHYAAATHELIAPWTRSVQPTPAMWFEYQGREFHIVSVNNVNERNAEWKFLCSEKVKVRDGDK